MVNIKEQFGTPSREQFTHSQKINGVFKVSLCLPEGVEAIVVFKFFESNEQFRGDVVQLVEECVHEFFRHLVFKVQELHSKLIKVVRTSRLFNFVFIYYFFEPLPFRKSQNVLGNVPQVNVFLKGLHKHQN